MPSSTIRSPLIASWPKRSVWLHLRVTCAALLTLVRPWRTCCPQSAPPRLPLFDTLQRAFAGSTSAAPAAPVPVSNISHRALPEFLPEPLTEQELKVLHLLAEGLSYKDIAEQLVISLSTARWHVHNVYAKLATGNRTQAIKRAQELGLL